MIETKNLTKSYGSLLAVNNLNITVSSSEIYGFLGPNGAGKTTTIKILVGLLKPTSGTALINGIDVMKEPLKTKTLIGYIPDEPLIYTKLTGREFLSFIADIFEIPLNYAKKKIDDLLDLFSLKDRSNTLIETYSHGMKQKLVFSAALLHDPEVLIMDEPTVGLDPQSAKLVKDIMRELANNGKTIFMSTHILEIAEKMCSRVGIINGGALIAEGTIYELREKTHDKAGDLEELFIELTGGEDTKDLIKSLSS
jgi:ABC-2 type transport system ATP-binding protein